MERGRTRPHPRVAQVHLSYYSFIHPTNSAGPPLGSSPPPEVEGAQMSQLVLASLGTQKDRQIDRQNDGSEERMHEVLQLLSSRHMV